MPDLYDEVNHHLADEIVRKRYPGQHLCYDGTCLVMIPDGRLRCRFHAAPEFRDIVSRSTGQNVTPDKASRAP